MIRFSFLLLCLIVVIGCGQSTSPGGETAVTEVAFNAAGAPTVEISMPDMMCPEGCGAAVREILSAQPGVKEVLVDFDAKKATVAVDKDAFDPAAALAALADRGFVNSTVNSGDAKPDGETAEPAVDAKPAG